MNFGLWIAHRIANQSGGNLPMPWIVSLKKSSRVIDMQYGERFFPRRYYYKRDAEIMADKVRKDKGEAEVKPASKQGEALIKVRRKHRG
jgi:hypothetical protein